MPGTGGAPGWGRPCGRAGLHKSLAAEQPG